MHLLKALAVLMVPVALASCGPPSPQQLAAEKAEQEGQIATLINLNGQLCARVVFVSPELSSGERQVNCDEYRDATKASTRHNLVVYMVNLNAGTVRSVGR